MFVQIMMSSTLLLRVESTTNDLKESLSQSEISRLMSLFFFLLLLHVLLLRVSLVGRGRCAIVLSVLRRVFFVRSWSHRTRPTTRPIATDTTPDETIRNARRPSVWPASAMQTGDDSEWGWTECSDGITTGRLTRRPSARQRQRAVSTRGPCCGSLLRVAIRRCSGLSSSTRQPHATPRAHAICALGFARIRY